MDHPLPVHRVTDAQLSQQVDRVLFEHACPDPILDVVAAVPLEHDRLDVLQVQKVREHQPRRPRPDDPNLCAHVRYSSDPEYHHIQYRSLEYAKQVLCSTIPNKTAERSVSLRPTTLGFKACAYTGQTLQSRITPPLKLGKLAGEVLNL